MTKPGRKALTMGSAGNAPSPAALWAQAEYEHPTDEAARSARYVELLRRHGHVVERVRPRCQSTHNFYGCTLDEGHAGEHESRSGCISAHRWS